MYAEIPYFMENKEWYYYDENEMICKLTDKAPQKAVESYNECYKKSVHIDENGIEWSYK